MSEKTNGSGLIFAVVLLFVILGMVVTLSSVTVLETKMNQKTKSSVGAFYNSESGVEWALNQIATTTNPDSTNIGIRFTMSGNKASCPGSIGGSNVCSLYLLDSGGNVLNSAAKVSEIEAVRSIGTQGGETQRAIEAAVAATDEKYQISCSTASAGNSPAFSTLTDVLLECCRIDKNTGATKCQASRNAGVWYNVPDPVWDADGGGKYQISCSVEAAVSGTSLSDSLIDCCRINMVTGETECRASNNAGAWFDVSQPRQDWFP